MNKIVVREAIETTLGLFKAPRQKVIWDHRESGRGEEFLNLKNF